MISLYRISIIPFHQCHLSLLSFFWLPPVDIFLLTYFTRDLPNWIVPSGYKKYWGYEWRGCTFSVTHRYRKNKLTEWRHDIRIPILLLTTQEVTQRSLMCSRLYVIHEWPSTIDLPTYPPTFLSLPTSLPPHPPTHLPICSPTYLLTCLPTYLPTVLRRLRNRCY